MRQAHYAAGDELQPGAGRSCPKPALEVSRLEERIRYVVEGRQRVEQRLAELKAQNAQWADAPATMPTAETRDTWPRRSSTPRSRPSCWPRRSRSRRSSCPSSKTRCARRRQAPARAARRRRAGAAADPGAGRRPAQHRGAVAPAEPARASAWRPTATRWPRPTRRAWPTCRRSWPRRRKPPSAADARLHELQEQVPQLDEDRRAQQDSVNTRSAQAGRPVGARWRRCARCRRRSRPRAS